MAVRAQAHRDRQDPSVDRVRVDRAQEGPSVLLVRVEHQVHRAQDAPAVAVAQVAAPVPVDNVEHLGVEVDVDVVERTISSRR